MSIVASARWSGSHSASVLIFPVSNWIGIFFVIISCVEFSFWIANGIVIDCIPSAQKKSSETVLHLKNKTFSPSSTVTWSCPDCIQLCSKFCGKLDKLSNKSFWLSNIFSLIFWFWVWMNSWCLVSSSKFLWDVKIGGGCCCVSFWWFCWFWLFIKKFSSFDESSQHDSSVDVMSSWNESWWFSFRKIAWNWQKKKMKFQIWCTSERQTWCGQRRKKNFLSF